MNWILDGAVAVVILGCAVAAWRKGLIRAVLGFLPMALALLGTKAVSPFIGRFLRETILFDQVRPKPGLEKFLSILKMEGVWMYVATATHRRLTEKALKTAGIDHYFRGIVTSADAGNHKSESADIYEMAMRRLQSNKRDTVVFEDALHAIRTAKAAGFRVAGVYEATAEQDQPEIQRLCDYYIRSYEELVQSETF